MLPPVAEYPPVERASVTKYGPFTIEPRGGQFVTSIGPINVGLPPTTTFEAAVEGARILATVLDERYESSAVTWERLTNAWNNLSPGRSTVDLSQVAAYFPGGKLSPLVLGWSIARLQHDQAMTSPDGRRLSIAPATGFYQQPKNQHLRVYIPSVNPMTSGWYAPMRIVLEVRNNYAGVSSFAAEVLEESEPPANVLNPKLYKIVKRLARKKFDVYPSAYANAWLVRTYKKLGGEYADSGEPHAGGLTQWFGEQWVDMSRPIYNDAGDLVGFEPCGRPVATSQADTGDYPKCRPLADALTMPPEQRADAVRRKQQAEATAPRRKGRAPTRVSTY